MARVRVHQHVNPLAKYFRELPVEPIDLVKTFGNPDLPLHLDIGCGRGRFLLEMAETAGDWNFLGVEIREPLVIEANQICEERDLRNLHYEFCNATVDLDILLKKLPEGTLQFVTIQFPDPWFKKRHAKRRMVSDKLVETLKDCLDHDARIFVQTDVEFLSREMDELFERSGFQGIYQDANPLPIKTEREKSVESRNLCVYRKLYKKNEKSKP